MTDAAQKVVAIAGDDAQGAADAHASVVADFKAELAATGKSVAQASREIGRGTGQGTLSLWMGGEYRGNVAAVTSRVRRWIETQRQSRAKGLGDAGLDRHVGLGVTAEIAGALALAQAMGDIVCIHGPSGAGKSTALERYCATHSAAYYVQMSGAVRSHAGMLGKIAVAVDATAAAASAIAAETAIVEQLKGRGALLVADEAHHLLPSLLDELRCLRDLSGAGLVLAGDHELWDTLAKGQHRNRCKQIVGRIAARVALDAPVDEDVLLLAASVLGREPTDAEANIVIEKAAEPGGMHALRRMFARAWLGARADGRGAITHEDLVQAREAAA